MSNANVSQNKTFISLSTESSRRDFIWFRRLNSWLIQTASRQRTNEETNYPTAPLTGNITIYPIDSSFQAEEKLDRK